MRAPALVLVLGLSAPWAGCAGRALVGDDVDLGAAPRAPDLAVPADLARPAAVTLSLLAGHLGGPGNLDGVGQAARLDLTDGLVGDGAGNLYVAEGTRIRRISLADGRTATLAVSLTAPSTLGYDAGRLYVVDGTFLRWIDLSTLTVTTLVDAAGNPQPLEDQPLTGLAVDPSGVYVGVGATAHVGQPCSIERLDPATGAFTLVAGGACTPTDGIGAAAGFEAPFTMAITSDGHGVLYVRDSAIRRVDVTSGAVTTVPTATGIIFNNGAGLSAGSDGLFVGAGGSDQCAVYAVAVPSGPSTLLAGSALGYVDAVGAAARFSRMRALVGDGEGAVFVADTLNYAVRRVAVGDGTVTTFAGLGARYGLVDGIGAEAWFFSPDALALAPNGDLWVSQQPTRGSDARIRRVSPSSGAVSSVDVVNPPMWSIVPLSNAAGFASDGNTGLWVADRAFGLIDRVDLTTGVVTPLAGSPQNPPNDVVRTLKDGTGAAASFRAPDRLVDDGAGNLYVTDVTALRRVRTSDGSVTTVAGGATAGFADGYGADAQFGFLIGAALDDSGNLYVVDNTNNLIRHVDVASGAVTTIVGAGGISGSADGIGSTARLNAPVDVVYDAGQPHHQRQWKPLSAPHRSVDQPCHHRARNRRRAGRPPGPNARRAPQHAIRPRPAPRRHYRHHRRKLPPPRARPVASGPNLGEWPGARSCVSLKRVRGQPAVDLVDIGGAPGGDGHRGPRFFGQRPCSGPRARR